MKNKILALIVAVFITACTGLPVSEISSVCMKGKCVDVELAKTEDQRAKGLMFRENLPQNKGMLFIYDKEEPSAFWMKNTLIPLDIIWIGEDMSIKNIVSAKPCITEKCPTYPSESPAKYVLEVNRGYTEKYNIRSGNKVEFR